MNALKIVGLGAAGWAACSVACIAWYVADERRWRRHNDTSRAIRDAAEHARRAIADANHTLWEQALRDVHVADQLDAAIHVGPVDLDGTEWEDWT